MTEPPKDKKTGVTGLADAATQSAIGLGYQLLAGMLFFVGGGYYFDYRRGGGSLFTLIGVGLAFVYGGYEVWKLVRAINKGDESAIPDKRKRDE